MIFAVLVAKWQGDCVVPVKEPALHLRRGDERNGSGSPDVLEHWCVYRSQSGEGMVPETIGPATDVQIGRPWAWNALDLRHAVSGGEAVRHVGQGHKEGIGLGMVST